MHKAGFVNIIGNPNVGKSTLMNALVGEKISIITPKAQTTRHRILGILNGENYQIVFSDTPGVLKPGYKLQEHMMRAVKSTVMDADIFILLTEVASGFDHHELLEQIQKTGVPVLLLLNKIDLSNMEQVVTRVEEWKSRFPNWLVLPISALQKFNLDQVLNKIVELLPTSPPFFTQDELTDRPQRFFVAEIIREKILLNYQKEIPYSVEVNVESFVEEDKLIRIRCVIYVSRESQKGIIIGHRGSMLKKVGTESRIDIEDFLGKKTFLELHVKVSKNWRENDTMLKRFGYSNQ
ncbi:MAG TPA: GTPase Era [Bacteroidales bacterium]|nr:GTPase Era [Bacteroidales bacterium]